jgi:hypothetical protein
MSVIRASGKDFPPKGGGGMTMWNRDTSGGIATGYGLDRRVLRFRVPVQATFSYSPRRPDRFWAQNTYCPTGKEDYFLRGKVSGA